MKILFPSVFYLPQAIGGIEYYIHNLAKGLLLKGHLVKIAVPAFEDYDNNMKDYEFDGLQVIRYGGCAPVGKLQITGIQANKSLDNFKELLAREKPDIVHFNQLTNSSGISLHHISAAKHIGAKVVYTNHLAEFICQRGDFKYFGKTDCDGYITVKKCTACLLNKRGLNNQIVRIVTFADNIVVKIIGEKNYAKQVVPVMLPGFATRWHVNKVESVIAISDTFVSIADWCSDLLKQNNWYKGNCVTINTGLFKTTTVQASIKTYDGKRPLKIIYIGRVVPVKGLDILIEAVAKMDKASVEVNIYGPKGHGSYISYIDKCMMLAKDNPNIIFHKQVENDEVIRVMNENDLLCIPSKGTEMAPLVIQEAMAANIPIVGSDLPAVKEWVKDGFNGLLFSVNDAEDLKNKLTHLVNEPSQLLVFKNNLSAPQSFENVINSYDNLYRSFFEKADIQKDR